MKRGFTLIELLLVIAILAMLFIVAVWNWRTQIGRGYDTRRKSDLARIKIAFEDYYNDNNCYPQEGILDVCDGPALVPYMPKIPCDPTRKTPYQYIPEADPCTGYRVLAALEDTSDPNIGTIGCSPVTGCGYGGVYNYGISSGVPVLGQGPPIGIQPTAPPPLPTATPTLPPTPAWACSPSGVCNFYANPQAAGCPQTFPSGSCNNQCGNPANRCEQ